VINVRDAHLLRSPRGDRCSEGSNARPAWVRVCAWCWKTHNLDRRQEPYGDPKRDRPPRNICRTRCGMVICRLTATREICDQTLEPVIEQTATSTPPTKNRYTVCICSSPCVWPSICTVDNRRRDSPRGNPSQSSACDPTSVGNRRRLPAVGL